MFVSRSRNENEQDFQRAHENHGSDGDENRKAFLVLATRIIV